MDTIAEISDIDQALRGICASGALPSSRDEYEQAYDEAKVHWVHYSWFFHSGTNTLHWQGNGDSNDGHYWKKFLTDEEKMQLPGNFLVRRAIDRSLLTPVVSRPDTPEEIAERRRIVAVALQKAFEGPLVAPTAERAG